MENYKTFRQSIKIELYSMFVLYNESLINMAADTGA